MSHSIRLHAIGPAENLKWESIPDPVPAAGQVLVRHQAIGINFIDVYLRTGVYAAPALPVTPGMEGAGVVEALGPDVTEFKVGDRVAYCGGTPGSYSEVRAMPADRLVPLPSDISCETAAAIMLKGLTAEYLLFRTARVQPGQTLLIHAAAGGVGLLVCAWAKAMGATVIGTVGSDEKAALARQHGCHHPIVYTRENFKARVLELTGGKGVSAVFDSVGKPTLADSIGCVDFFGQAVSFGQSGGTPDPVATSQLAPKSACLSRPTLFHHTARRADLLAMSSRLFEAVRAGILSLRIGGRYPLAQAAQAHRELESRMTTGSLLLMP